MGTVARVFTPKPKPTAAPVITASEPVASTLTDTVTAERQPARQATREPTSTERRVAAVQGQTNLTNVLAGDTEGGTNGRARRRALGV